MGVSKGLEGRIMARAKTESMRHVGMTREAMKSAVMERLNIGQQYQFTSGRDDSSDKRVNNVVYCKLLYFSRNAAVFEDKDGRKETLTYQELWQMLMKRKIL